MLYPSMEPNERFRARRDQTRRRKRRRRALALATALVAVLAVAGGMTLVTKSGDAAKTEAVGDRDRSRDDRGAHASETVAGRDQGRARDRAAGVAARQARGVRRLHEARAQHDRARPQGRGRHRQLQLAGAPAGRADRRVAEELQARACRTPGAPARCLSDRPRRRLPGSRARRGTTGSRRADARWRDVDDTAGARLGEPVRQAGLGVRGLRGRGGGEGRLRRDHARLRALPVRRRRRRAPCIRVARARRAAG